MLTLFLLLHSKFRPFACPFLFGPFLLPQLKSYSFAYPYPPALFENSPPCSPLCLPLPCCLIQKLAPLLAHFLGPSFWSQQRPCPHAPSFARPFSLASLNLPLCLPSCLVFPPCLSRDLAPMLAPLLTPFLLCQSTPRPLLAFILVGNHFSQAIPHKYSRFFLPRGAFHFQSV